MRSHDDYEVDILREHFTSAGTTSLIECLKESWKQRRMKKEQLFGLWDEIIEERVTLQLLHSIYQQTVSTPQTESTPQTVSQKCDWFRATEQDDNRESQQSPMPESLKQPRKIWRPNGSHLSGAQNVSQDVLQNSPKNRNKPDNRKTLDIFHFFQKKKWGVK